MAENHFREPIVPNRRITGETQSGFPTEVALLNWTDEQLLAQALAGDEDAFTALYRRRQGPIFRFALHMSGSTQIAEEVTQDVFVFLLQRGQDFDPSRGSLGAFLFGVARNYVRRALERSYSEALLNTPADDEEQSLVTADDPADRIAQRQTSTALWKAVLSLPEHYREVVVLCDLQEQSYAEAAAALGCAIGTIRSRLHRAHEMLGRKLKHSAARPGTHFGSYSEVCIMTCREFKHATASLTLWELARSDDRELFDHAVECATCAVWLDEQQMLATGMRALQARTARRAARPQVERALLRTFRQLRSEAIRPVAAQRSAPLAFRLSRFFEIGAYAAVAAAIVVGLFLGARLLEHAAAHPVQSQAVTTTPAPAQQVQAAPSAGRREVAAVAPEQKVMPVKREVARPVARAVRTAHAGADAALPSTADPDYVALMFCDPLICSSDVEVVRMELPIPGAGDHSAQTQVADVVVGDDGLVRAMRLVN